MHRTSVTDGQLSNSGKPEILEVITDKQPDEVKSIKRKINNNIRHRDR